MLSFLLSLGLSFGAINLETLPVAEVQAIAQDVMEKMQSEMRTQPTLMVTERPEPTPLGALNFASGKCVVIINTNKQAWAQWNRFLNTHNRQEWQGIIAASVAHEMGHCLREGRQYVNANIGLEEEFSGIRHTGGGKSDLQKMIYRQELFADAVAILYARENAGQSADEIIKALIHAREQHGSSEPTHNTAEILSRLIETDTTRQDRETIGSAAARLLLSL